jgi:hypothetical protein
MVKCSKPLRPSRRIHSIWRWWRRNHPHLQLLLQLARASVGEDAGGPMAQHGSQLPWPDTWRGSPGVRGPPQQQFLGRSLGAVVLGSEAESGAPCPSRGTRLTRACAHLVIGAWAAVARASRDNMKSGRNAAAASGLLTCSSEMQASSAGLPLAASWRLPKRSSSREHASSACLLLAASSSWPNASASR